MEKLLNEDMIYATGMISFIQVPEHFRLVSSRRVNELSVPLWSEGLQEVLMCFGYRSSEPNANVGSNQMHESESNGSLVTIKRDLC